jgi:hypothetical protein
VVVPFERTLPYVVTARGGAVHRGEITLGSGIAPLRVTAPGEVIVIEGDTFLLGGRTAKDGRVTANGRPVVVDAAGRFSQLMKVASVGEATLTVRADLKDHAPRLARVKVRRVASLADEAARLRADAASDYSAVVGGGAGVRVALVGEVVEARLDGEVTVLLLDVRKGCPSGTCLARVVYGGRFKAARGSTVQVLGRVSRSVEGPRTGARVPEIAADLLLHGLQGKTR